MKAKITEYILDLIIMVYLYIAGIMLIPLLYIAFPNLRFNTNILGILIFFLFSSKGLLFYYQKLNKKEVINQMSKENNWINELNNLEIGGDYLTIHNAFKYIISIDLSEKPKKVKKTYKGHDAGFRFQWKAHLFNIDIIDQDLANKLKEEKPDKFEKIIDMKAGEEYILELPKGATKDLANFIKEKNYNSKQLVRLTRSGEGWQTEYHFQLATEEELGY